MDISLVAWLGHSRSLVVRNHLSKYQEFQRDVMWAPQKVSEIMWGGDGGGGGGGGGGWCGCELGLFLVGARHSTIRQWHLCNNILVAKRKTTVTRFTGIKAPVSPAYNHFRFQGTQGIVHANSGARSVRSSFADEWEHTRLSLHCHHR